MDRSGQGDRNIRPDRPHVCAVGVGGRDWPALAQRARQEGKLLTGTIDGPPPTPGQLRRIEAPLPSPSRRLAGRLPRSAELIIHGPHVGREHPARLGALRRGLDQLTPADWLRRAASGRPGAVVAGGAGASTIAAMTGWILLRAGLDPSVWLREAAPQLGGWSRLGGGPHLVAVWPEEPSTLASLGNDWRIALRVDEGRGAPGLILALPSTVVAADAPCPVSAGEADDRGWWAADVREKSGGVRFRAFDRGRFATEVLLTRPGVDQVPLALAAVAACARLGVPMDDVREGLAEFAGLARRFEDRGSYRGVRLIDDAAGEPAAVRDAVALARRQFGRRRLWAVVACPRSLATAGSPCYPEALVDADRVMALPGPEAEPGPPGGPCAADVLTRTLARRGRAAVRVDDVAGAIAELDRHLEPGDVVLTLGAGDVGTIADAFIRRLSRDRQGG